MSRPFPDRRIRVPELFAFLLGVLQVQQTDAYEFWQALDRAVWSEAVALKGLFTFHKNSDVYTETDGLRFLHQQLNPQRIVGVVEALVQEKQLPRATASRLEAAIFARMTAHGTWTTA